MLEDKNKTKFSLQILSVSYEATQVEDSKNRDVILKQYRICHLLLIYFNSCNNYSMHECFALMYVCVAPRMSLMPKEVIRSPTLEFLVVVSRHVELNPGLLQEQ